MKKCFALILSLLLVLIGIPACTDDTGQNNNSHNEGGTIPPAAAGKILVAYFSCTGTTEDIAEIVAEETGGALHKILPAVPYTE